MELREAVDKIQQTGGYHTYTYDALRYLREVGFGQGSGHRDGVIKVAIVITDGQSDDTAKTIAEATLTHLAGELVTMATVATMTT